jgi:hypothetical protein
LDEFIDFQRKATGHRAEPHFLAGLRTAGEQTGSTNRHVAQNIVVICPAADCIGLSLQYVRQLAQEIAERIARLLSAQKCPREPEQRIQDRNFHL